MSKINRVKKFRKNDRRKTVLNKVNEIRQRKINFSEILPQINFEVSKNGSKNASIFGDYFNKMVDLVDFNASLNKLQEKMKKRQGENEARYLKSFMKRNVRLSNSESKYKYYKKDSLFNKKFNIEEYGVQPIALTEQNVVVINTLVKGKFNAKKKEANKVSVILTFKNLEMIEYDYYKNFNVDEAMMKRKNGLKNRLYDLMIQPRGSSSSGVLSLIKIVVLEIVKFRKGGCDKREHFTRDVIDKSLTYLKTSVVAKDNNCGLQVFRKYAILNKILIIKKANREKGVEKSVTLNGVETKDFYPKILRKTLFPDMLYNAMLSVDDLEVLADYYKIGFRVYDEEYALCKYYKVECDNVANFRLFDSHYTLIEALKKQKCGRCSVHFVNTHNCILENPDATKCLGCGRVYMNEHTCSQDMIDYYQSQIMKDTTIITAGKKRAVEPEDLTKIMVYDFETFNETVKNVKGLEYNKKAQVYAVGYKFIGGDLKSDIGPGTIERFVDYIVELSEGKDKVIMSAYNGSRFDSYFIVEELNKRGIAPTQMTISGGAMIILRVGNVSFFDLCKFLMCPLSAACRSFKIANSKTEFDHTKVNSFEDVETHKEEILEYLKFDILSLEELSMKMSKTFYDKYQIHLHSYITASHLTYSLFRMKKQHSLYLIQDEEKYRFIRKSIIGGRTYPLQKYYKSQHFDRCMAIKNSNISEEEKKVLISAIYKEAVTVTKDFTFNGDVNSLYPAAMLKRYPCGKERVSSEPKKEFDAGLMGFYEIKYKANKELIISPLPNKSESGRLEWSVEDGIGVYNSIDIKNAISMGYKVEFINTCIVWDETDFVIKPFIEELYTWKKECKESGNKVGYQLAKLLMNSLYGKFLQGAMTDDLKVCKSIWDVYKFMEKSHITNFTHIKSGVMLEGKKKNVQECITKPNYLGSFILGYSREIMYEYMKVISPKLKAHPFTYSDTDSLHFPGSCYQKFTERGMIHNSDLGKMSNDVDDFDGDSSFAHNIGPIIMNEVNLAPKNYCYWYISASGEFKTTMKSKGIPKKSTDRLGNKITLLNTAMYLEEKPVTKEFFTFRKIHKTVFSTDIKKGLGHFSIVPQYNTRTFNKTPWKGMDYKEGSTKYYPKGYCYRGVMDIVRDNWMDGEAMRRELC